MKKELLFDKISDLKEKFQSFFQHRKKITALENFSIDAKFAHKNYLSLVKECMTEGFLGARESDFLDYMLGRYELNYLDWAHKTKWLKAQMKEKEQKVQKPRPIQEFFNFDRQQASLHMPVEMLIAKTAQVAKRI